MIFTGIVILVHIYTLKSYLGHLQGNMRPTASELATKNICMNKAYILVCINSLTLDLKKPFFIIFLHAFFSVFSVLTVSS